MSKTQRVLWFCFGLGLVTHLLLTQIGGVQDEQKVVRPLTTQFVKRQPRLTKPLELKKRPQPKRRSIQRTMVSVKAKMQQDQRDVRFQPTQALSGLARPNVTIGRIAGLGRMDIEPKSIAEIIEGTKEVEQKIDMSLELLDISALNTGKHHAMVVQDPHDKRNVKGFCRLSWLYIPRLHDTHMPETKGMGLVWANFYIGGSIRGLADAMNRYTGIDTYVGQRLNIDDPEMFRIPWVFHLYFLYAYRLSDGELETLGRYLKQGGFILADTSCFEEWSVAASHQKNLLLALETQGISTDFEILPNSHPIYHCYFDFSGPPPGVDALIHRRTDLNGVWTPYLEGLIVDERLVAILSKKGLYSGWCDWGPNDLNMDATRPFQFGVNLIVFALTQEGSITHRLMDSVK